MEDRDLRFNLTIRVYGEGYKTHLSHGFLVDDMPMGVSAPVATLVIDVRQVTLCQLRPMLMYDIRGAMKRRSSIWQEVLFIFGRLHNVYNRPKNEVNKYQFGFVKKSKLDDIKLIHPSFESRPIAELIGAIDYFMHDLVIVPITQLSPEIEHAPPPAPPPAPAEAAGPASEPDSVAAPTPNPAPAQPPSPSSPPVAQRGLSRESRRAKSPPQISSPGKPRASAKKK